MKLFDTRKSRGPFRVSVFVSSRPIKVTPSPAPHRFVAYWRPNCIMHAPRQLRGSRSVKLDLILVSSGCKMAAGLVALNSRKTLVTRHKPSCVIVVYTRVRAGRVTEKIQRLDKSRRRYKDEAYTKGNALRARLEVGRCTSLWSEDEILFKNIEGGGSTKLRAHKHIRAA